MNKKTVIGFCFRDRHIVADFYRLTASAAYRKYLTKEGYHVNQISVEEFKSIRKNHNLSKILKENSNSLSLFIDIPVLIYDDKMGKTIVLTNDIIEIKTNMRAKITFSVYKASRRSHDQHAE